MMTKVDWNQKLQIVNIFNINYGIFKFLINLLQGNF